MRMLKLSLLALVVGPWLPEKPERRAMPDADGGKGRLARVFGPGSQLLAQLQRELDSDYLPHSRTGPQN
jgi:hypothetical protein